MRALRKRLTYANVMSSIAVFLVLGGATAVAAKKIGSNEIKGNSITTGKVKKKGRITDQGQESRDRRLEVGWRCGDHQQDR